MDAILNVFETDRATATPTTERSFTLKLTGAPFLHDLDLVNYVEWIGVRVERDPQGPYKPSRVLGLTVDDVDRSVSFPSRGGMSPWVWEIENESAV